MTIIYKKLGWVVKIDESLRAISPVDGDESSFSFIFDDNTSIKLTGKNIIEVMDAKKHAVHLFETYVQLVNMENVDPDEEEEPEEEDHVF